MSWLIPQPTSAVFSDTGHSPVCQQDRRKVDPGEQRTSTRAVLLAATGQNCWPPPGSYMTATGQDLMAADIRSLLPPSPQLLPLGRVHQWAGMGEAIVHTPPLMVMS